MKKTKYTVKLRNKLAEMVSDFDSCACIEDRGMTESDRKYYQEKFRKILKEIDEALFPEVYKKE